MEWFTYILIFLLTFDIFINIYSLKKNKEYKNSLSKQLLEKPINQNTKIIFSKLQKLESENKILAYDIQEVSNSIDQISHPARWVQNSYSSPEIFH